MSEEQSPPGNRTCKVVKKASTTRICHSTTLWAVLGHNSFIEYKFDVLDILLASWCIHDRINVPIKREHARTFQFQLGRVNNTPRGQAQARQVPDRSRRGNPHQVIVPRWVCPHQSAAIESRASAYPGKTAVQWSWYSSPNAIITHQSCIRLMRVAECSSPTTD